tara:strand:- start:262 stop:1155 length:894 start_codon:yes stop_codon:yes gene_type:complete
MDKIFYNESSSLKLGWTPDWFGATSFDEELLDLIASYQKDHSLSSDGMCGPTTYRRIWTERESNIADYQPAELISRDESFIICNNNYVEIDWPHVVLPFESNGLRLTSGYKTVQEKRTVTNFVSHWDVCLSTQSCYNVLKQRGISVHFGIDNDGTIYQFMDCNHIAWHAGSSMWNNNSIGVEITNAYYPKYQDWYKDHGYGERPLWTSKRVHGQLLDPFLGFYGRQLQALQALMKAIHKEYQIRLVCPTAPNGKTSTGVSKAAKDAKFNGFISHYHLTKNKIDCAGLDLKALLKEIK